MQLVAHALDVVQGVGDDDDGPAEGALHGGGVRGAGVLLRGGGGVGAAVDAEGLVVDQHDGEVGGGGGVGVGGDAGAEGGDELLGAVGLAGGGVARDDDELDRGLVFNVGGGDRVTILTGMDEEGVRLFGA